MRLCCALVSLLGICGAMPGQGRPQVFKTGDAINALEARTGAVAGGVEPADRLVRLITPALQGEATVGRVFQAGGARGGRDRAMIVQGNTRGGRDRVLMVQGDKESLDFMQSVLDEMRREPLPRFHLTCTVLVMPAEIAVAHGLAHAAQEVDMVAMTNLMRDVVKAKGTLLNLPETIATPFVPFVAEPRVGVEGKPPPPDGVESFRLRGEALAVSPEEALFGVQLVRGSLPDDRTVVPEAPVIDRAFRLRVRSGVTLTAKDDKTATVLWLRFTGTSTFTPKADKTDKADTKDENGKR